MNRSGRHPGFVLLVTMIILIVLSALVAGLSLQLMMAKRRQNYMVEYQRARYGLDSAMKYILAEIPRRKFSVNSREDKPDFSDLFWMDQAEYTEFIAGWVTMATDEQIEAVLKKDASLSQSKSLDPTEMFSQLASILGASQEEPNETDAGGYLPEDEYYVAEIDPNDIQVPGPYGPPWPYVIEPIELEIGPAEITITVEDENAKMPLSWLVSSSENRPDQVQYALETYCVWMARTDEDLNILEETIDTAADSIHKIKAFNINAGPIILKKTTTTSRGVSTKTRSRTVTRRRQPSRRTTKQTKTTTQKRPAIAHTTDFAKLFHSSLVNRETLARPLADTGLREENPLKYLGLWGSRQVNVNTAPRHVLESAFTMVMDSFSIPEFTQQVIDQRKEKPFTKIDELKELGNFDSETMTELKKYLTTQSTFFKIRVVSHSGNARASAVATVVKQGSNAEKLAIIYEH